MENRLCKYFIGTREQFAKWIIENPGVIDDKMICFIHPEIEESKGDEGEGWIYTRGVFFEMKKANVKVDGIDVRSGDMYINVETTKDGETIVKSVSIKKSNILNKDSEVSDDAANDDKIITNGYLKKVFELNKTIEILN